MRIDMGMIQDSCWGYSNIKDRGVCGSNRSLVTLIYIVWWFEFLFWLSEKKRYFSFSFENGKENGTWLLGKIYILELRESFIRMMSGWPQVARWGSDSPPREGGLDQRNGVMEFAGLWYLNLFLRWIRVGILHQYGSLGVAIPFQGELRWKLPQSV